ncbi:MAG: bifunctional acetate--CoA ligase family protein/GNAT family N-acetyltransferase [Hyphomicrobium aestuarii]|nr:bifunctional acetate--CoA ligase family protein/GNAT family N-acetyltransferase [Hyphomicrobium aestuarii]
MTIRNLDALLSPRSIVLLGASDRPGGVGAVVTRNLISGGFKGDIWLVNPGHAMINGTVCYPSIAELPGTPDLAVIATPAATVPALIDQLGQKGCRSAVVITAGIRGDLKQAMLEAAGRYLIRIQGPNCLGLMLPPLGINASFSHLMPPAGNLAFLSQSGALITGIVDWAASRRIGFSHVVSMGDMADVDAGDLLDYLAGDTASDAILMYVENVTAARKFMSAARRAARAKPVIVIKSGRHAAGAAAALSHTGALAGADHAYQAAFRRAGVLRVREISELFSAAELLAKCPPVGGERLVIVTNGGGAGVLAADRLTDLGGQLATLSQETIAALDAVLPPTWSHRNPIDIIGDANAVRFSSTLAHALDDPGIDAALVINCPTALNPSLDAANAILEVVANRRANGKPAKPVLTAWLGVTAAESSRALFSRSGLPTFETPADAIEGFAQLSRYRQAQVELMALPTSAVATATTDADAKVQHIIAVALRSGRTTLTEFEAKSLLAAYAIPVAETAIATTPAEAERLSAPIITQHGACVVKILSVDISHKSDVGGVRLDLETPAQVREATKLMLTRCIAAKPDAKIDGFTIQPMIKRPHAQELLLGVSVDPTFGPLITFGAGGIAVETIRDVAHALPPLDMNLARDLMRQTNVWRLLQGYRDRPPADIDAIAVVLVRLAELAARHPEIREIDINPLLADELGVIALDGRVAIANQATSPRTAMAIKPYPSAWEREFDAATMGKIVLRPIRPEDEPLYEAFFAKVDPADVRLRFFTPKVALSHRFLARLTQIDYDREMAFVAIAPDTGELLGVARFIADPDFVAGEYGVLVRSDLKGQGIGWALMSHLIDYAHGAGLKRLYGHILHHNTTMLQMCRELGFTTAPDVDDLSLVKAELVFPSLWPQLNLQQK